MQLNWTPEDKEAAHNLGFALIGLTTPTPKIAPVPNSLKFARPLLAPRGFELLKAEGETLCTPRSVIQAGVRGLAADGHALCQKAIAIIICAKLQEPT